MIGGTPTAIATMTPILSPYERQDHPEQLSEESPPEPELDVPVVPLEVVEPDELLEPEEVPEDEAPVTAGPTVMVTVVLSADGA